MHSHCVRKNAFGRTAEQVGFKPTTFHLLSVCSADRAIGLRYNTNLHTYWGVSANGAPKGLEHKQWRKHENTSKTLIRNHL